MNISLSFTSSNTRSSSIARARATPRKRITVLLGTAIAVAAMTFAFGPASPALAHDQLVSTTPSSEAVLDVAPEQVTLSFSNNIIEVGTVINVTAADGSSAADGEPRIDGRDVHQALRADLPDGGYEVVWRVVSKDGHPINGAFSFAVGETSGADVPASTVPDAEHEHDDAASDSHEHADEADHADSVTTSAPESNVWASPLLWAGIAGSLVLVTLVIIVTVRSANRRARTQRSAQADQAAGSDVDTTTSASNSADSASSVSGD